MSEDQTLLTRWGPELLIEAGPALRRWSVRVNPINRESLEQQLGVPLPARPLRALGREHVASLWMGPDEWLILADASFAMASATVAASIVDVSHRHLSLRISGAAATWILNAACPLNLSDGPFGPGSCTRTLFGKVEIVLWRLERNEPTFHVEYGRSFADYVARRLRLALEESRPD